MISRRTLGRKAAIDLTASLLSALAGPAAAQAKSTAGVRRAVKNGTDPDAAQVSPKP